jgi:dsDNA-binding SOS-regulon protein
MIEKKPYNLKERTFKFSKEIFLFLYNYKYNYLTNIIFKQLLRSSSSIDANKSEKLSAFINESKELVKILDKIIKNSRAH